MSFKFLLDQPLKAQELLNAKFGHDQIATTLTEIIKNCATPFSIALCGRWGTGKSTVVNAVQKNLESNPEIAVVYFDVWKYEDDALRRSFLKEADKQLKAKNQLSEDFELHERLDSHVSVDSIGRVTLEPLEKLVKQFWKPVAVGLAVVAGVTLGFYYVGWLSPYFSAWKTTLTLLGGAVGLTSIASLISLFFVQVVPRMIKTETTTYGIDRYSDPHEFEEEFGKLLGALKTKRLLVVFDNIDRVTHDKAIAVLSTVKTFLEPKDLEVRQKEAVFLIPCDIEAIKAHVRNVYQKQGTALSPAFDENEFIRKFFNALTSIPDFIITELEDYAAEMLEATNVGELKNDQVAWLVTKEFRENPRQIKQFINSLLSAYLLVQQQKAANALRPEDITVPELAKFLILELKYGIALEILKREKEWNLQEISKETQGLLTKDNHGAFFKFIADTGDVPIHHLDIFFTLRHSVQEQQVRGSELFITYLKDRETDAAAKFIDGLAADFDKVKKDLTQIIKEGWEKTQNEATRFKMLETLLPILHNKNLKLDQNKNIYSIFSTFLLSRPDEEFKTLPPDVVFGELVTSQNSTYQKKFTDKYLGTIEEQDSGEEKDQLNDDFYFEIVKQIAGYPHLFSNQKTRVQAILSDYFYYTPDTIDTFRAIDLQREFLSPKFLQAYIDNISAETVNLATVQQSMKLIKGLEKIRTEIWDLNATQTLIQKFIAISHHDNAQLYEPQRAEIKKVYLQIFNSVFNELGYAFANIKDKSYWQPLVNELRTGLQAAPDISVRKLYIPALMSIQVYLPQAESDIISELVKSYLDDVSVKLPDLEEVLKKNQDKHILSPLYKDNIANRAVNDPAIFTWYYAIIDDPHKTSLLKKQIEKSIDRFDEVIKELKYIVPDLKAVVEAVLNKIPKAGNPGKAIIYKVCNQLKCANDATLKGKFNSQLSESIRSEDQELQKIATEAFKAAVYFDQEDIRETTKAVIDWLISPATNPHQELSIRTVLSGWHTLNTQPAKQQQFVQFVFDKLLAGSTDTKIIALGLECLVFIKSTYANYETHFLDLKRHIKKESNSDLQKQLIEGLANLKDAMQIPDSHEFWDGLLREEKKEEVKAVSTDKLAEPVSNKEPK